MEFYEEWLEKAGSFSKEKHRPLINICYAQSLDGSIAAAPGSKIFLSGPESNLLTHELRARHDAILVGVGTILSDDPCLTVRLIKGGNPQPVIIDSLLKTPTHSRIFKENPIRPWFMTTTNAPANRISELQSLGASVVILPSDSSGRVNLTLALKKLSEMGIGSVMVEGGARIISSFLSENLADHLVLTIAMVFIGGSHIQSVDDSMSHFRLMKHSFPRLKNTGHKLLGDDLTIWGDF